MMSKKTKLYVVRHGETPANLSGTVTGRSEDVLTTNGKAQMLKIRQEISGIKFDAVYASPMKRCVESVQLVAPEYDPIYDDRLAERDLGDLKNYQIDDLWQNPLWNSLDVLQMPTGTETLLSGLERVKSFLADLDPNDKTILLVTHSFISRCLWIITNNITDPEKMSNFVHPNDELHIYEC